MMIANAFRLLLAAALILALPWPATAADERDLLPIDQAFMPSAQVDGPGRIRLNWKIADGYYLYRHRMSAEVGGGRASPLQLPAGAAHDDEFFGRVETFRNDVEGIIENVVADGDRITLQLRYQGCADIGICYPPHRRNLTVAMPALAAASASDRPTAADDPQSGLDALNRALGGGGDTWQPVPSNHPLPPERAFGFEAVVDGDLILVRLTPAKGYYLYRDRSHFSLENGAGFTLGEPRWPRGTDHHDEHFGNVIVYFDQVEIPLPLRRSRTEATTLTLSASFQGCQSDGICYPPMTRKAVLELPAGTATTTPAPAEAGGGVIAPAATTRTDNAVRSRAPTAVSGVAGAMLLALLGGLLLNAMPCVLPILSLKILGLAQSGASRQHARRHALWYTAGVLSSFASVGLLAAALRAGGQALGWGFQLQQPGFVAALVLLMTAVGLSLSGVFTVGGNGNFGQSLAARGGAVGDFFTGALAVVVASPCIAPFMGPALAYAFAAPSAAAIAVFLALGLGLALPFLLVGSIPALARRLPKPGRWMETFKQALAFPMYLSAVWLAWVLGRQRGVDTMALTIAGAALLGLALWWLEKTKMHRGWMRRLPPLALLVAALSSIPLSARLEAAPATAHASRDGQLAYSAERLRRLRASGDVVFVNITADWCVTCKANERTTLSTTAFTDALQRTGAVYMVGDWTNTDPQISQFLQMHGAVGVPLYVVYPRGGGPGEVLPAVLDPATVVAALERAATPR